MALFGERCLILSADLMAPLPATLDRTAGASGSSTMTGARARRPVDLVVSGYAIHHLPDERKRSLYEEIYSVLAPGGMFLNLEHVSSPSPELENVWERLFVRRLAADTGKPLSQVEEEFRTRPDREDNILQSAELQVNWLREMGFRHADCYFKWLELALFGGIK
jgi:tRNA (cmo5U34)-methyltransferase